MAITAETAGTDEAHIRSVEEIMAQQKQEEEQAKAESQKMKQQMQSMINKAKGITNKIEGMTSNLDGMKDKLMTMSLIFGTESELGQMFSNLSEEIDSIKTDAEAIAEEGEAATGSSESEAPQSETAETSTGKDKSETTKSNNATVTEASKTAEKDKETLYVPPEDTLNEIKSKSEASKAAGNKGKMLKYTPEQMVQMNPSDLGNVIKSGFAGDMKSSPVTSFLTSQFGAAEAAAVVAPMAASVTKRLKKLPEIVKPEVSFMEKSFNINAPDFDATDFLTTEKDTSQLYESAFDYGEMFFGDGDKRMGDVEDETVTKHRTTEEIIAERDAKYGKADSNVNYNTTENEFGLVMGG